LHWSFLTPKRYREAADWSKWLDHRVQFPGEPALFHLSASDELLALVMHGFIHHELSSLLQWLDIALVSLDPSVDWDYIDRWCQVAGVSKIFWSTLGLVNSLLTLGLHQRCKVWNPEVTAPCPATSMAYFAPLFGVDSRWHLVRRRRHLLEVAPTRWLKLLQVLRFVSMDELRQFLKPGISARNFK
jgi:hypothetical protein